MDFLDFIIEIIMTTLSIVLFIVLIILPPLIILANFITYWTNDRIITNKQLWGLTQVWAVIFLPIIFLAVFDFNEPNDCCSDSAVFSPQHRGGVYILIGLCMLAFLVSLARKSLLPPFAELVLNIFLVLGIVLNVLLCKHLTIANNEFLSLWAIFDLPIIFLFLIRLNENQQLLTQYIETHDLKTERILRKICLAILNLDPLLKYPVLALLAVPFIALLSSILVLFGQKPDSVIRAFTDTYKHGFSQLDYMCENVDCGGHFLCSVGANGHKSIVKPIRYGERHGHKIICNRQLLVSNAFEELVQEKMPKTHRWIRKNYNKVGDVIHQHYHIFNHKIVADVVYLLMKPLEIIFLLTLYIFDKKPENRIAAQYLSAKDRKEIREKLID